MSGSFDDRTGALDLSTARIVTATGVKHGGKSIIQLVLFRSYPGDRVVIDVAGDDGPWGEGVVDLVGTVDTLPAKWPEEYRHDEQPMILRYVPDTGSPTVREDMDHVVGLAMEHGDCCVLVHEMGLLAPANRTPPHTRRLLNANRHAGVTALFCGPRPQTIDPLIIAQSDVLYVFELRNKRDRVRIAENIGQDPAEFDAAMAQLGRYEYLRFDANEPAPEQPGDVDLRLIHFDEPLPAELVEDTKRWAHGGVKQPTSHMSGVSHAR